MIKVYPYDKLGQADFGWLQARYHFSFGQYRNSDRVGFGNLRVINDDIVHAGEGFGTHPHDNMEIITYVRRGAITHRDSLGNTGRTKAGDIQVMSAGRGVEHSEHNEETENTSLYQIWIIPNQRDVEPRWEARSFPKTAVNDELPILVSGYAEHQGEGVLFIHGDALIRGGRIDQDVSFDQPIKHQAYVLVSEGELSLNGEVIKKGDGAEITGVDHVTIKALQDSEIVLIDVQNAA